MDFFSLDDVINATLDRASVVSEEHDTGKINAQAALLDERELAKMYSAEQIQAMRTDPKRQREAVEAANKRAALDNTGGRVRAVFAKTPGWHQLGITFSDVFSSSDALIRGGLDIPVAKIPMSYSWNGETRKSDDTFAIVREDTGEQFGSVGKRYSVIQNRDAFGLLDGVLAEHGAKYESAGSLYNGCKVFICAQMPRHSFSVGKASDEQMPYLFLFNTHDGSGSMPLFPVAFRPECANTARIALNTRKGGINIRHTGDVKSKIKDAQKALGLTVKGIEQYKESAELMYRTPCEPLEYFDGILDSVLDITKAEMQRGADALAASIAVTMAEREAARKLAEHKIKTRREIFDDMLTRYESERCANGRGTLWSAFNAVTESADHGIAGGRLRGDDKQSRRFESVISGRADEIKQVAYVQAISRA